MKNHNISFDLQAALDALRQGKERVFIILCQPLVHRARYGSTRSLKCIASCDSARFQFCTGWLHFFQSSENTGTE